MASTIKPSGLTIARDGALKYAISWKIADKDYNEGQLLQWRVWLSSTKNQTKWTEKALERGQTKATITLPVSDYYPTTKKCIYYFEVRIAGKRAQTSSTQGGVTTITTYDWSAWAEAMRAVKVPNAPKVTAELDDEVENKTTFSWEVENPGNDNRPFRSVEWQSILVANCKETNGSKLKWKNPTTGTGSATGSWPKTDDFSATSQTRWFRIRSRGAGGIGDTAGRSAWKYVKHVYATPYAATINSAKATVQNSVTTITMNWTATSDAAHPIDTTTVQYCITVPGADLTVPTGATWTDAGTFKDTSGRDSAKFSVSDAISLDQCLFVRVQTKHDERANYSAPKLVSKAKLTAPTGLSVTTNESTYRATVTATNNSAVPDSRLAVIYKTRKRTLVVGIIPHGQTTVTVQCPNWSSAGGVSFGVYAFQGTATPKPRAGGVTAYAMKRNMYSASLYDGGSVPLAPDSVTAAMSDRAGEVILTWDWTWSEANIAEISWSQNENAWESTEEPSKYTIDNLNAALWRVSGLATGVRWYFRIRLIQEDEDGQTAGPYCDPVFVDLSSAPAKPVLTLSAAVVTEDGSVTANWTYVSTDSTGQANAEIAVVSGSTYTQIANASSAQHVTIPASDWTAGNTYLLAVRVTSLSGVVSEWSDPVPVIVAEPLACEITTINLTHETITYGDATREVDSLKALPLTLTVTGAGDGGTTTVIVERAESYQMIRPDDTAFDGFEGETIILYRQTGEDAISIGSDVLLGRLDDGAPYRLIATVEDGLGQTASQTVDFDVNWTHQAGVPTATVTTEDTVAVIEATAPSSYATGDTVDIYRLSADRPVLIVEGGAFGTEYVDPYPAVGEMAGYRVVCMTSNDDYITADEQPAWVDVVGPLLDAQTGIIDFNGESIPLVYNVDVQSQWKKDFKETKYLGGTVRGDWNPAISRTQTVAMAVPSSDTELMQALRRLAEWDGICHVRTQDGSSFAADVQVSNTASYNVGGRIENFTLTITRVEPERLDGLTYEEWSA